MSEEERDIEELKDIEEEGPKFLLVESFEEELLTRLGSYIKNANLFKRDNMDLRRKKKSLTFKLDYVSAMLADLYVVFVLKAYPQPSEGGPPKPPRILRNAYDRYLKKVKKFKPEDNFVETFLKSRNLPLICGAKEWREFLDHLSVLLGLGRSTLKGEPDEKGKI